MFIFESVAPLSTWGLIALSSLDFALVESQSVLVLLAEEGAAPEQELTFVQALFNNPLIPIAVLFFLFYFILILPERRRKAEEARMMSSLKKNDRVVTVGGIHGTVVSTSNESSVITIRIDESSNTRIKVNRSAIASVLNDGKENKDSKDKETSTTTKDK
ncbi:MAG: preprotein translocase subunit YajC [Pirellulales bacterium]|nr:preprotein translocase subunit YajC [Pirellulales bacterium]